MVVPGSLLFYDFETDGSDPTTCRPLQFAAIRTNDSLEPIQESETVLWCQPPMDRLPAPAACLVTGITPQKAAAHGRKEADFFQEIQGLLATPGTTSLGWNSLRYDDIVCRFGFWRNFHDPYEHTWRDHCTAWDLIDLARAARALRPEGMAWPEHENGKPSFKLEHLSVANGIEHEDAHDALGDVRATIAIGQRLRKAQPDLWDWARSLTDTDTVEKQLAGSDPLVHVSARIPAAVGCTSPIRVLAPHPRNKRSFICWDLRHDPSELFKADVDEITHRTFSKSEALQEGESRFALKEIKSNRAPFLAPLVVLESADRTLLQLDDNLWKTHDEMFRSNQSALDKLRGRLQEVYQRAPVDPVDADDAIYAGFPSKDDQRLRARVVKTSPSKLAALGDSFLDPRLRSLMLHYRARNAPETLDRDEVEAWTSRCRKRILEPPGKEDLAWPDWLDEVQAQARNANLTPQEQEVLASVKSWGLELAEKLGLPIKATT